MFLYIGIIVAAALSLLFARRFLKKKKRPAKGTVDAIVFSGPSGVGKGTIIQKLMTEKPGVFAFCVSHTTRPPREGELNGVNYHFTTLEEMKAMEARGEFLECCTVHGNMYGTSKKALQAVKDTGKIPIIEIDVQGAQKMKQQQGTLNFYYIFISAPTVEELEKRIVGRGQESAERVKTRLETAKREMTFVESPEGKKIYDRVIVNTNLNETVSTIQRAFKLYCGIP